MKSADVIPGQVYECKITGRLVQAFVLLRRPAGTWLVRNLQTHRLAILKSPQRFRALVAPDRVVVGRD